MGGHRRHSRREEPSVQNNGMNLNGIDLNSIASIVNSIDMNQLTSILGSLGQSQGANDGDEERPSNRQGIREREERRREIVNALNVLANADRAELIQIVLQLYGPNRTANK